MCAAASLVGDRSSPARHATGNRGRRVRPNAVSDAAFAHLPADEEPGYAERTGAILYEVLGVELGYHGAECSFDAIIKKYELIDPALLCLARIVRGADTPDKDLTPESRGLEAIADGFRRLYTDDQEQLAAESIVYDALYVFCQQSVADTC